VTEEKRSSIFILVLYGAWIVIDFVYEKQIGTQLCGLLSCEHACRPTPDGRGRCYCPIGFQINPANNRSCIGKNQIFFFQTFN
jgi:hypothetical protein